MIVCVLGCGLGIVSEEPQSSCDGEAPGVIVCKVPGKGWPRDSFPNDEWANERTGLSHIS